MGWAGEWGSPSSPPHTLTLAQPYLHSCSKTPARRPTTNSTEYRIQDTENRIHDKESCVHKITNVPLFYMALGLKDFDAEKSITRAVEGGGVVLKRTCPHQIITTHVM